MNYVAFPASHLAVPKGDTLKDLALDTVSNSKTFGNIWIDIG
jgi:hypothetical protein